MPSERDTSEAAIDTAGAQGTDLRLEVVVIPVSDIDRAKDFYGGLGWRLDADVARDGFRLIQINASGLRVLDPVRDGPDLGSARLGQRSLPDRVRHRGGTRGADRSRCRGQRGVPRGSDRGPFHPAGASDRISGPAPQRQSYGSFASFADPDGNIWLMQEITSRLPGRVDPAPTGFESASELSKALARAAAAHGEHEARIGREDPDWPDWYAEYMVREQAGDQLPR